MDAIDVLNKLIEEQTQSTINSYSKEYKESKWYKMPTLREVFGDAISSDICRFKEALEKGYDVYPFVQEFEIAASRYGASWYDEDLGCERTGYEFETQMYVNLRNIAGRKMGIIPIDWEDYYEGRGV